ncbi:unnamed protein product [Acanthoscelides obtectus]|uniref:Uncharacterized protein n=2 Tax=Acanthoscelides obtectus TaxID=200917 RepID=A0A9P0MHV4_ACAOB|nr:unnamed protein product [Acanthoscelides obtectus]CAK1619895.1 Thyrotropin receptor [Acanthoscelides obtectus]
MRYMLLCIVVMNIDYTNMEVLKERSKCEIGSEVHCYGKEITYIPTDLPRNLTKLVITEANIEYISKEWLDPYRPHLRDITLSNLPYLRDIEQGTFANIPNLRTLYISHAPRLKYLSGLLKGVTSSTFYSLRIVFTGLVEVPELHHLTENNTMFLLDLDHNEIERLPSNSIRIVAEQVTINFNSRLVVIEDHAFNGSQIAELSMHSNYKLTEINELAFKGLKSLRILDLSQSAIKKLPTEGLEDLETLKIEDTPTMQTIPSIYDLKNLRAAKLTHSFHCCAFRYPAQHDPERHAQYEENMKKICEELRKYKIGHKSARKKRSISKTRVYAGELRLDTLKEDNADWSLNSVHQQKYNHQKNEDEDDFFNLDSSEESEEEEELGIFHSKPTEVNSTQTDPHCGRISFQTPEVECMPDPNALNPCEDIMGVEWLRISVWCVVG